MEAPLAKAIRSADGFIKGTYIWFFVSIFFIWGGWRWISRNSASMIFDCNASGCTLTIQTPYYFLPRNSRDGVPIKMKSKSKRKIKIELNRDQIVRADNVKWDPESQQILENYGINSPSYAKQQQDNNNEEDGEGGGPNKFDRKKKKKKKYKKKYNKSGNYRNGGPDSEGNYDSYLIILRDPLPPSFESGGEEEEDDPNESPSMKMQRKMAAQHSSMTNDPNSLASLLEPFAITEDASKRVLSGNTEYNIHLRDFNLGQTRRLARTSVAKINAYTKGRRASCIIRESRPVAWQGLVLLILGIFSFVLCLLLGQFWEEHDPTKFGSYRKRMAEIRKREEAKKIRSSRRNARRPPVRKPGSSTQSRSTTSTGGGARSSASRAQQATGGARMRPNASVGRTQGADSWVGSVGGATHGYTKRGY